jgi:hypothetical protein
LLANARNGACFELEKSHDQDEQAVREPEPESLSLRGRRALHLHDELQLQGVRVRQAVRQVIA